MSNNTDSEQGLADSESTKELISNLISETISNIRGDDNNETRENEKAVVTPVAQPRIKRDRKLTEKGFEYKLEIVAKERDEARSKLTKQVKRIYSFLHEGIDHYSLEIERESLDTTKENFNEAHETLCNLSQEEDKEALYQYFDLRDREYLECRTRVCDRLRELEKALQKTKSIKSCKSRSSSSSTKSRSSSSSSYCSSRQSALVKQLEAETKAAKVEIELKFLELDTKIRKLQLQKEAELAKAEASTASRFLEQIAPSPETSEARERKDTREDSPLRNTKKREYSPSRDMKERKDTREDSPSRDTKEKRDTKKDSPLRDMKKREDLPSRDIKKKELPPRDIKKEQDPSRSPYTKPDAPVFDPKLSWPYPNVKGPAENPLIEPVIARNDYSLGLGESTFRELIRLQERQTELSAMIVNQQRMSSLPVQEPPVFSGEFLDYPIFIQAFETIIESKVDADKDRLYFLSKFTTGKANDVVKGFVTLNTSDGYKQAKKLLAQRFGNPHHVAEAYKSKLRKWPEIKDEDGSILQDFSDFLVRCREAMECLQYMEELNSAETLIMVSAKLPSYAGVKWCRYARELQRKTGTAVLFKDLVKFVREEAELANDPVFSPNVLKKERNKGLFLESTNSRPIPRRLPGANTLLTSSASNSDHRTAKPSIQCPSCTGNHGLEDCKEYTERDVKQRVEFIRSSGLCFGCLRKGHISKNCRTRLQCKECNKYHPTSIHDPNVKKEPSKESSTQQSRDQAISNCANAVNSVTNSLILPVWLHHKSHPEQEVMVYALLDNASDTTFIKTSVLKDLGIQGTELTLKLYTMHGKAEVPVQKIEGLMVERHDRGAQLELPKSYSRDYIPYRRNQVPTPETASKWPHLKKLENEIPPYNSDLDVGILIGCNCPRALKPREVILGRADDPYAVRTLLGWGIVGPVMPPNDLNDTVGEEVDMLTSNRILSSEVGNKGQVSDKFVATIQTKEVVNPFDVRKVLETDFSEKNDTKSALSQEDRQFLAKVNEGTYHLPNGHYEVPLPLKSGEANLPNNRDMALQRLKHLKRRMDSDTKYKEDYMAFMKSTIAQGHAEKVPAEDISTSTRPIWYIPHHGVYHPKKRKIRVVFDCSAQFKGESLNKHLLQGPDLTNNLVGVLCRFREEPIAFICDVEGMFHQVQVRQEHRDFLRFLWWEDGDTHKEPQEYRMTVHLFGATSSPGCANFALKSTANDHEAEIGSAAAEFLRNDFYVDDGLKSVATTDEAIKLIKDTSEMCRKGGFNLHKFVSNDKQVIASVPEASRAEDIKTLDLNHDALPIERALGVQWCVESDTFNFRVVLSDRPATRRGILSTVSSVFDPLGFVAPFILEGKKILQELCKDNAKWDDPVSEEIKTRWYKWKTNVQALAELTVSRCYKPPDFGDVVEKELHHFSDASTKGYGQCSYLRLRNERGDIHCSFVMGKARVTPLKPMTIPRLELTAALVSARVSDQIKKELRLENITEIFWTDSKVVLGYINNESRRFHIFVANRVQEIQEKTSPNQWRYVETSLNPADIASRGISASDLPDSAWINAPEFLWKDEKHWPTTMKGQNEVIDDLKGNDPEIKKSLTLATVSKISFATLEERLQYFPTWHRAKKAVALCIRYKNELRHRVATKKHSSQDKETPAAPIQAERSKIDVTTVFKFTVEEMQQAEKVIIKTVQDSSFEEEIAAIKSTAATRSAQANVKKNSPLRKLDVFLNTDGILRVGGRLRRANLSDATKFPVLLPRSSHVSTLIIRHYHEQYHHQGRSQTLNEIRSNGFWILSGSVAVGSLVFNCVTCRKLRGKLQEQKMADLPEDRLEPAAPFTNCAVDYFGPWIIKQGRKEVKRYGALFTCMASRAIHLETSASLETDSFINALRRFLCRRGPIRQIRCDQGTNFVGARNELKKCLTELDHDKIRSELLKVNCDWFVFKMNIPSASHMGGVWERQIRSVRNVLQALLEVNGTQLDDESLNTLMCEAEAIVNSRPLTVDALNDPDSLDPLTPNHLLTLKTKILLPPPSNFQAEDLYSRKRWRRVQHLSNEFWSRWKKEYLHTLQQRNKWTQQCKNLEIGDIVIIKDQDLPRNKWELGRVIKANESQDGHVRSVQLLLADPSLDHEGKRTKAMRTLERPIHKLVMLSREPQRHMKTRTTTTHEDSNLNDTRRLEPQRHMKTRTSTTHEDSSFNDT